MSEKLKNISYQTLDLALFFQNHRRKWDEFYPSERWILDRVVRDDRGFGNVLDVGCAVGGLATALSERAKVQSYTGIDINTRAIEVAGNLTAALPFPGEFHAGDICEIGVLGTRGFDMVTALSVVDWNVDARGILAACWRHVAPGGHLVLSLRLTLEKTVCDVGRSYQYIWGRSGPPDPDAEIAPYNVFNVVDALKLLVGSSPNPAHVLAYGYWGNPSATARTPFHRLLFSVFAVRKPSAGEGQDQTVVETHFPVSAFLGL